MLAMSQSQEDNMLGKVEPMRGQLRVCNICAVLMACLFDMLEVMFNNTAHTASNTSSTTPKTTQYQQGHNNHKVNVVLSIQLSQTIIVTLVSYSHAQTR
jgi:hypothetical protein